MVATSDLILEPLIPTTLSMRTSIQLQDFFKANKLDGSKIHPFIHYAGDTKEITSLYQP